MHHMISSGQYIAEKLLKINERRSWSDPPPVDTAARANQDEQIFQTANLVKLVALIFYHASRKRLSLSCGHFMSAIMGDYVAGFLGSSEGCNWNMDAFDVSQIVLAACFLQPVDCFNRLSRPRTMSYQEVRVTIVVWSSTFCTA